MNPPTEGVLGFAEDTYGSVKRVHVFRDWIEQFRPRVQGGPLTLLDYGCGTGARLTVPLSLRGDRVHGVDVHAPSIDVARATYQLPNVSFGTESTRELVDAGRTFDIVVCSEVLEHLHDPGSVLRDFHQLLRPGGELFVTVPNGYGAFENLKRVEAVMNRVGVGRVAGEIQWALRAAKWRLKGQGWPSRPRRGRDGDSDGQGYLNFDSGHVQFFRERVLAELFEASGFQLREKRGRTLICGPYVDFFASHLSLGGRVFELNNRLADRLPLALSAGWMFRLEKRH